MTRVRAYLSVLLCILCTLHALVEPPSECPVVTLTWRTPTDVCVRLDFKHWKIPRHALVVRQNSATFNVQCLQHERSSFVRLPPGYAPEDECIHADSNECVLKLNVVIDVDGQLHMCLDPWIYLVRFDRFRE